MSSPVKKVPTRIGTVRPSHLVHTSGVGAIVDLPTMSVIVRSLDLWPRDRAELVHEPRLLEAVRTALGPSVKELRAAPFDADDPDKEWSGLGVPVTTFPRWMRCPVCYRLAPLDPEGFFKFIHRHPRRPDLAGWVHVTCGKQTVTPEARRRTCVPARFVVVCEQHGHLDDFPYVFFVHDGGSCDNPQLTMSDAGTTEGPNVTIKCQCGQQANMQGATGPDASSRLPVCRGRHPHLGTHSQCGQPLRMMVLGASNLWFSDTVSALHLPDEDPVLSLMREHRDKLTKVDDADELAERIADSRALSALAEHDAGQLWHALLVVRKEIAEDGADDVDEAALRDAEWEQLCHPTTSNQDKDFRAAETDPPRDYAGWLQTVVEVTKLRETTAVLGLTRVEQPGDPARRISLSRGAPSWVPVADQRGEGIFLQLDEGLVARWSGRVRDHDRVVAIGAARDLWFTNRGAVPPADTDVPRMLLLHTLSHLLVRQVALECGYSSAAIRERLYLGHPTRPTAGILLSTAASDSEGTLGGLVALADKKFLGRLLGLAFEEAERCSSDPLCSSQVPGPFEEDAWGAACHACLFASETTCAHHNVYLDRAVWVGSDDLVFPR